MASRVQRLRAALRGDQRGEIGELLRLQGEKLVARLRCLKCAGCGLARRNEAVHRRARAVDVTDDAGLNAQRVLERADAILPARIGVGDHLRVGAGERGASVAAVECLLDVSHVVGDPLRFAEKLLRALDLLLQLLERTERQRGEIARLVGEARRCLLDLLNLVVDLLERPSRRQHILGVVRRIIDDPAELGVGGRGCGDADQARRGDRTGQHGAAENGCFHGVVSFKARGSWPASSRPPASG